MADLGLTNGENRGKVTYDESIINGIVAVALGGVEGVVLKSDKKNKKSLTGQYLSGKKSIEVPNKRRKQRKTSY